MASKCFLNVKYMAWLVKSAKLRLQLFNGSQRVEEIASIAKAYAATNELGLICVDYLQLVKPTETGRNITRERQVSHIATSLKNLAMEIGVPVMTATQVNKQGEARGK